MDDRLETQIATAEPVKIRLLDHGDLYCTGQVSEVSRRDMKVQLDRPLQLGEAVYAAVQSAVMLAEVRYCRPEFGAYVVGLELVTRLSEEDVTFLLQSAGPVPERIVTEESQEQATLLAAADEPAEEISDELFVEDWSPALLAAVAQVELALEEHQEDAPVLPAEPPPVVATEAGAAGAPNRPSEVGAALLTPRLAEAIEGLHALLDAMPERKIFLTLREASIYSGLPQSYLRKMHSEGKLTFLGTGAGYRIRRTDLEKL